tara:strand:- start:3170 stop:3445 length:276 start_codon:yes stop_codon:yes gene_type:complete
VGFFISAFLFPHIKFLFFYESAQFASTQRYTLVPNPCLISFMAIDKEGRSVNVSSYTPQEKNDFQLDLVAMHAKYFTKQLDMHFTKTTGVH